LYQCASEIWPGKRGGLYWGDNRHIVIAYYQCVSEIWPGKRGTKTNMK
jgi:hypothetical protein